MSTLDHRRTDPASLEVRVEPMRRRHLRAVLRIEGRTQPSGWSLGLFMSELGARHGRIYLVARAGGSVVGFAGALLVGDEVHVTTISVDPAWQGRRVAARMLLVLMRRAVALGAAAATLEVRASNEPAIRLYRRFGFAPAGVRAAYYSDTGEDALIMWASDLASQAYTSRLDEVEAALPTPTVVAEVGW